MRIVEHIYSTVRQQRTSSVKAESGCKRVLGLRSPSGSRSGTVEVGMNPDVNDSSPYVTVIPVDYSQNANTASRSASRSRSNNPPKSGGTSSHRKKNKMRTDMESDYRYFNLALFAHPTN